jgi:hypothetical protein
MIANSVSGLQAVGNEIPKSLRIIGRQPTRENADICGRYLLVGSNEGYPVYQNDTNSIAIRFWKPLGRWVLDRSGIRDSDVAVAFAMGPANCFHPAHPDLIWHVWESAARAHVPDSEVVAVDAPDRLTFVGRDPTKENSVLNGTYHMACVIHGRPAYQKQQGEHGGLTVRYHAPIGRWLVSFNKDIGNTSCTAFAEAGNSTHPGEFGMRWQFWEAQRKTFVLDQSAGFADAPEKVRVLGRAPNTPGAIINGTYHLASIHGSRPLYVNMDTQAVIRYSTKNDWWLIDCEGLQKPSLLSRIYQWAWSGDIESAFDRCTAYCDAHGVGHPGDMDLMWHIWDPLSEQHKLDSDVMTTAAPHSLEVSGRDAIRENAEINGRYELSGAKKGRPVYRKVGSDMALYFSRFNKWVLDRHGVSDNGVFVAYTEDTSAAELPGQATWHVWDNARGTFVIDPAVSIAPLEFEKPAYPILMDAPPSLVSAHRGVKRQPWMQHEGGGIGASPRMKVARTASRDTSGWYTPFGA